MPNLQSRSVIIVQVGPQPRPTVCNVSRELVGDASHHDMRNPDVRAGLHVVVPALAYTGNRPFVLPSGCGVSVPTSRPRSPLALGCRFFVHTCGGEAALPGQLTSQLLSVTQRGYYPVHGGARAFGKVLPLIRYPPDLNMRVASADDSRARRPRRTQPCSAGSGRVTASSLPVAIVVL
ncbi:hypothetical protein SKAU_G00272480 [Synaphobranchus kaupii]|uniref:Uncharacterized protein n=1 Tax=Synaphobranchus kaupii TaxID=118154 RepID=A0A9Q1IQQ4_SYNKA|nr:hypothetical protein SKAU_G00272480 [Synaphobranchus kaupii]